jgi:hypothetical protein
LNLSDGGLTNVDVCNTICSIICTSALQIATSRKTHSTKTKNSHGTAGKLLSAAAQREPSYIQLSPRGLREAARGAAGVGRVAGPVGAAGRQGRRGAGGGVEWPRGVQVSVPTAAAIRRAGARCRAGTKGNSPLYSSVSRNATMTTRMTSLVEALGS